jgi:hypothetical protein
VCRETYLMILLQSCWLSPLKRKYKKIC